MPKIKTLTAKSFRGIREATLTFDNCSMILLGENGTGKSSFVDALEFFFAGRVSHLEGAQAVSTLRHAPHIHATQDETAVEVMFERFNGPIIRTFKGLPHVLPELQEYIDLGARSTFILRRKNLLDFILAQPGPRYQQLAAIIGVDDLDKVERALKEARDDLLTARERLESEIRAEEEELKALLGEPAIGDEQMLKALNARLAALKEEPLSSLDEAEQRKISLVARSRSATDTQRAVTVRGALNLATDLAEPPLPFSETYHRLWNEVEALQRDTERVRQVLFQEVLSAGYRLLSQFDLDRCPVCLQPIERETLLASLEKRVREAEQVAQQVAVVEGLRSQLANQIQGRKAQAGQLTKYVTDLQSVVNRQAFEQYAELLKQLLSVLQAEPVDMCLTPLETLSQCPEVTAFVASLSELSATLRTEQERLEPTDQDRLIVSVIDLLTHVMDSLQKLITLRPKYRAKSGAYQEMAAVYDCFVDTKRTDVRSIYRELEADIKRFFHMLHTGEGYREVRLDVDEDRRASTEIKMDFHERESEDPRAFNSEGHLDSLGLCVFLAFVKRFNSGFPLMVLDDVVSSIDSGHRQHICQLLSQEFCDCQLFITTHDYIWFEELCAHQRAYKRGHLYTNWQILDWSLENGPRLDKYKPRWERIEDKLANGDRDGAAADTRKLLEHLLYELAIAIKAPVSLRRDTKYVVGDLHGPVVKQAKKLVPDMYNQQIATFQRLEADGIFGNLLVHNNPRAANASLEEARSFANAVKDFEKLFTCDNCGRLIEYNREAKVVKCLCGALLWVTRE